MQKSSLEVIESQTEVRYWLMSGTEEVRNWVTLLGSTHYNFWRYLTSCDLSAQTHSEDTVLKCFGFPLVQLVLFSGKSKPGSSKGVGSDHSELAPLACDLYCSKGSTLRRDPTSALPVLKCFIILEQGVPHICFVSHTFIFPSSCKLGSWSWAPSGMLMRKERYPPSFSYLPYKFKSKLYCFFLQLVSCCLPLVFLLTHPSRPSYWFWDQEQRCAPIKSYL